MPLATKQKSLNSDEQGIEYAIRAKTSAAMRAQIAVVSASDWMPFLDKKGKAVNGQDTAPASSR